MFEQRKLGVSIILTLQAAEVRLPFPSSGQTVGRKSAVEKSVSDTVSRKEG